MQLSASTVLKSPWISPDIYNEDWLFFATHAAQGQVISVGTARQQPYKPFADPNRAVMEEFGDLIAEGLYALFNDGQSLDAATEAYWHDFMKARGKLIERLAEDLYLIETHEAVQAYESMLHAGKQLASIEAEDCVRFVRAWRYDRGAFARTANEMPAVGNYAAACEYLELTRWREAEFGLSGQRRSRLTGAPKPVRSQTTPPGTPTPGRSDLPETPSADHVGEKLFGPLLSTWNRLYATGGPEAHPEIEAPSVDIAVNDPEQDFLDPGFPLTIDQPVHQSAPDTESAELRRHPDRLDVPPLRRLRVLARPGNPDDAMGGTGDDPPGLLNG